MIVRRVLAALVAMVSVLGLSVLAIGPAGATTGPSLRLLPTEDVCRGMSVFIAGSGFTPGQSYDFTATFGTLRSTTLVARDDGTLTAALQIPADPGTATTSTVTAAATNSPAVMVASLVIQGFGTAWVELPFSPSVDPTLPVYSAGTQLELIGGCFLAGEAVQLSSPQMTFGTAQVGQGSYGNVDILATVLAVHTTGTATVTATGMSSGHSASVQITTGGPVLDPGTELNESGFGQLVSASGHYRLRMFYTGIYVCRFPSSRPQTYTCDQTWSPVTLAGSQQLPVILRLRTDGNLVLLDGTRPIWSTGTSGTGNQLTMRDDGNLALTDAQHVVLWSSNTGLVRGPAGYVSSAYIAGSRKGSAVYVNGLVKQWNRSAQLVRGAHRLVYLERLINGVWQNMLSRTADSAGQLAVGFVQSKAYNYRLLMVAAGGATGALSATIAR